MSRLVTDLNSLRNWVSLGLARMISSGVALLGLLATLAVFHPPTAGVMLVVLGVVLGGNLLLVPRCAVGFAKVRKHRGRLANRVGEQLLAALTNCHLAGRSGNCTGCSGMGSGFGTPRCVGPRWAPCCGAVRSSVTASQSSRSCMWWRRQPCRRLRGRVAPP